MRVLERRSRRNFVLMYLMGSSMAPRARLKTIESVQKNPTLISKPWVAKS
jgi:hypothetical protein